jgi:hypothetical protein
LLEGKVAPGEAMKQADAAWRKIGAATPPDQLRAWRRRAVGLN